MNFPSKWRGAKALAACLTLTLASGGMVIAAPAVAPQGQTATPAQGVQVAQRKKTQQPQAQPRAETPAPASAGGPGRYAVLREENKDSGCLINLQQSGRAQLGPGCKDQGVVVFDPIGWSSARNALVLRARKGHRITFVYQPDGTFLRDPADKRPLAIRKH